VNEREIISQVLRGNIDAFRLLVGKYQDSIGRFAANLLGDRHIGEDVAQDVFFAAYKKLASFDSARSNFSTWLFSIARNKCINEMKKKKVVSANELPEKITANNLSDGIASQELFAELDKALQTLPGRQKRAFIFAEFENLPYQEIAQIEGVRIGTVKSRINRAKKKLRAALEIFNVETI
jgi:RNA polymerase sigma-70 factor (ECF subfamily)